MRATRGELHAIVARARELADGARAARARNDASRTVNNALRTRMRAMYARMHPRDEP
ncbi:MAG: hypothetical protein JWO79_3053 [Actinomycetia bacterium]|nr:hypothetical protein [Actinomycetes bacterium]